MCSRPSECVECWALSLRVSLFSFQSLTFPHSLFSFPYCFPSVCLLVASSSSFLLSFFSVSPPTGVVCIPARRGGGVCDPCSIRTRPPLPRVPPHPLPGKMGATSSLAGHRFPFWVCCQPWQQRLNMICLSAAAACLHQTLAPRPITAARDSKGWLVGSLHMYSIVTLLQMGGGGLKGWWIGRVGGDAGSDQG